jgi:hypothetical protein
MQNQPGSGPTRQDKTTERMEQERRSPGATSAGGQGADAPNNDTSEDPTSSQAGGNLNSSANTAARRGDVASEKSTDTAPSISPAV